MSLTQRLISTYILLLVGSWFVSWGMQESGSISYLPGLYAFASTMRWLLLMPILIFATTWILTVWPELSAEFHSRTFEEKSEPKLSHDEIIRREKMAEEYRHERIEQEIQKRIREKKEKQEREMRIEEERLLRLKEKQTRSPAQAAKSALDDF